MYVIRSKHTGMFLTRFPAYMAKEKAVGFEAVWFNDIDLLAFAWVGTAVEARKVSLPADILGLFAGLTLDPHGVEVCQVIEADDKGFHILPVGTVANLIERGIKSASA